jgi:hypothetical protein
MAQLIFNVFEKRMETSKTGHSRRLSTRQRQNGQAEVGNAFAKVSHTRFCVFPHNLAPDFLQYISGNPNQRTLKIMKV